MNISVKYCLLIIVLLSTLGGCATSTRIISAEEYAEKDAMWTKVIMGRKGEKGSECDRSGRSLYCETYYAQGDRVYEYMDMMCRNVCQVKGGGTWISNKPKPLVACMVEGSKDIEILDLSFDSNRGHHSLFPNAFERCHSLVRSILSGNLR